MIILLTIFQTYEIFYALKLKINEYFFSSLTVSNIFVNSYRKKSIVKIEEKKKVTLN